MQNEVFKKVRTRIAPSPTGDPHVGTGYMALFNYVFAKKHGGDFILRIEDTDQARSSAESEQAILNALQWLGIDWDEGPDKPGPHGCYRQSERSEIYEAHAKQLVSAGHAFPCFCTAERLAKLRAQQMEQGQTSGYDGLCSHLSADAVKQRLASGESHVLRMKIPADGECVVQDMLRGEVRFPWSQVDMQVLLKADGLPTYHLANVVDDHLMEISHVIRGEEWLNSAPKHYLLYQYFGWQMPQLCHLPLLRNPDKSKLSKRKNPTSILFYQRMGFLPEALLNYLGRMGWSMPDEREQFKLEEMIAEFDLQRMSLGGPVFDVQKLRWLNSIWMREQLSPNELVKRIQQWALNAEYMRPMLDDALARIETFTDLAPLLQFYFSGEVRLRAEDFAETNSDLEWHKTLLQLALWYLESVRQWDKAHILTGFQALAQQMDIKLKALMPTFFIAISGQKSSVPVMDAMVHLGPDMTRYRLRCAIDALGGLSKKSLKQLEKQQIQPK